jgi:hypothetical protein
VKDLTDGASVTHSNERDPLRGCEVSTPSGRDPCAWDNNAGYVNKMLGLSSRLSYDSEGRPYLDDFLMRRHAMRHGVYVADASVAKDNQIAVAVDVAGFNKPRLARPLVRRGGFIIERRR